MDSLTQITLGAAVGELVLGKKIGNRALLWGAVAGTIPDLDVLSSPFVTELQALVYHRGLSHSILFAVLFAFIMAWLVHRLYQLPYYHYIASVLWFTFPVGIWYFLSRFEVGFSPLLGIGFVIGTLTLLYYRYFRGQNEKPNALYADWVKLFFWGLITHPLLDCFTTYGTQLFQPFTSFRIAFNTISVADPLYTIPFLLCIIIVSFLARHNNWRRKLTQLGLIISTCYMLLCLYHKRQVHQVLIQSLAQEQISYRRVMTSPTILNNILWYCLAETDDGYYSGLYSLWDEDQTVRLQFTPRNEQLLELNGTTDHTVNTLKWFSNNYYCITKRGPQLLQFNDMRFGKFDESAESNSYVFNFPIVQTDDKVYELTKVQGGPPPRDRKRALQNLWERLNRN